MAPSILSADFARLGEEVRAVVAAGADQIHVDVMDGHFVPNLSMGPLVCEALRRVTDLPLDVHLMITDPARYADSFIRAGATHITFHIETESDHLALCATLRARGIGCGISVNPETPVERIEHLLDVVDLVLVMTVHPGFGGQSFLEGNLSKVRHARRHYDEARSRDPNARVADIQVDGGVDADTIARCAEAGANVFVAGSAIFRASDPVEALRSLRRRAEIAIRGPVDGAASAG
jgi:ribulose-phosphate 3-epimerase